jgi:endonuclease/exonuclease/phosphatase family metal-dependent hydrolase
MQQRTKDQRLAFFVNNARRKHPRNEIILAGDLNCNPDEARKLAKNSTCKYVKKTTNYQHTSRVGETP